MSMAQLPGEVATYPTKEIARIVVFLDNVSSTFESDPVVRDEFFALVTAFGEGCADSGAVVARTTELLAGHPHLIAQFRACLAGGAAEAALNGGLVATTRPRRSNRPRPAPTAAAEPSMSAGDAAVDDEHDNRLRLKRERERARRAAARATAAAGVARGGDDGEDPRLPGALEFLRRVKERGGDEVFWRFLKAMYDARDDAGMAADAVYGRVAEALGPAHGDLLRAFAEYLPGEAEWEEQEAARKRRRAAADAHTPRLPAKKPRADDVRHAPDVSSGGGTVPQGRYDGKLLRFKIKNAGYDDARHRRHDHRAEGGNASRGHDDDYDVIKLNKLKPRADDYSSWNGRRTSEGSGSEATARVEDTTSRRTITGEGGAGSVAAPARAKGHNGNDEFARFRAWWEFETGYSTLLATVARAEELLQDHSAAFDDGVSLEALFPSRDSREFLERLYGEQWGFMRTDLEDGELTGPALGVVLRSLRWAEELAVKDARERRDRARASEGLNDLVTERIDEERRRGNAGDQAA